MTTSSDPVVLAKHNKRHLDHDQNLGDSKGFGSAVPEMGMKTKYLSLVMNHNITGGLCICFHYFRHFYK